MINSRALFSATSSSDELDDAIINGYNFSEEDMKEINELGSQILHGFFEGLCLIIFDNTLYLIDDKQEIMHQQTLDSQVYSFNRFCSKLEFDGNNYFFVAYNYHSQVAHIYNVKIDDGNISISWLKKYTCLVG